MRIAWYDHQLTHQSAAIPGLPDPEDMLFIYGNKGHLHNRVNVCGGEMWAIPLRHRLLEDGHEIVALTRRKVDPMPELDEDLARLVEVRPEFAPHVAEHDPCLNEDQFRQWPVRTALNSHYFTDQSLLFKDEEAPTTEMIRYWVREEVLGIPPDVDVFVCAVMRADEATAFECSYFQAVYLKRGTPVVLWDQDHQLGGTVAAFKRLDLPWPHPLVTVIGPYEERVRGIEPETIDYPYVTKFERDPLPVSERIGGIYVGNDYGRRAAMERLLLHLPTSALLPVTVYGRYDAKDGPKWTMKHQQVRWAGRIPANRVPEVVSRGLFTVNMVKDDYVPIGLLTLRTFDANCYGTIQYGDRRIKRLAQYVPEDYLVESRDEATALARRIRSFSDSNYASELERQRELTRRNDMDHFIARFYEIVDLAISKQKIVDLSDLQPKPARVRFRDTPVGEMLPPGVLGKRDDPRLPMRHQHVEGGDWSPDWKENKEAAKA